MKTPTYLGHTLSHPVKSRVIYDLLATATGTVFLALVCKIFEVPVPPPATVMAYPPLLVIVGRLYGVYSRYRMAHPAVKSGIMVHATLSLSAWYTLFYPEAIFYLIILTFFTAIVCGMPRWFFNLTQKPILSRQVNLLIRENQPILVVGGGGYIGNHVVRELLKRGKTVRVLDTFYYGKEIFGDIKSSRLQIHTGDVTDLFALTSAIHDVQAVVHLAGIVGDPACALDDALTRHLNIATTRMLKEQTKAFRIPRFVFASSCSVYGSAETLMTETSRLNPVSLYAQTKIDAEKEILGDPFDEFHPTVLRFATVFGDSPRMRFDLVVNLFVAQAYYDGVITVTGSRQWRPFVHVHDLARAIATVIDAPVETVSRQVFNVGDDALNITIGDLAQLVADVVVKDKRGRKVRVVVNDQVDDRRNYHVSFKKINQILGYGASYNLEKGIREIHRRMVKGDYAHTYTDAIYSNKEMTKLIQTEFHSPTYQQSHFSLLAAAT